MQLNAKMNLQSVVHRICAKVTFVFLIKAHYDKEQHGTNTLGSRSKTTNSN